MDRVSADSVLGLAETSLLIGVSPFTLRAWIAKGSGPPHLRIGRQIKFRHADVQAWLAAQAAPVTGASA